MLSQLLMKYKTINDISNARLNVLNQPVKAEDRGKIAIAIIDDQPFEAARNLTTYGYEIKEVGDLKSINEIASFPIVLCDLMDVGAFFDKKAHGASIIKEIRKNYPATYVLAYSGSASSDPLVLRASMYADGFIRKDAELDEWTDTLDRYISDASDVRKTWQRIRSALVEESVDTKDLLKLEDAFVRAYLAGDETLKDMSSIANKMKVGNSAKSIVEGLIASTLFKIIAGV